MNVLLSALLGFLAAIVSLAIALLLLGWWIAKGESDVNGDPERDAGLLKDGEQLCPDCLGYDPDCECRRSRASRPVISSTKNSTLKTI